MWKGGNQEAVIEGSGGELGGPGSWGLQDAACLLARASLPILFPWPLPLGSSALTVLLGALTSLFLWYCYRLGSEDMQALGAGSRAGGASGMPDVCSQTGPRGLGGPGEGLRAEGLVSRRLRAYARRYSWAGMGRVRRAAQGVSGLAGGTGVMGIQRPGLLFLPDLPSSPFVPRDAQRHDVELLQSSFPAILRDFGAVSWDFSGTTPLPRGWSPPVAPGCYQLLLYQAGRCQPSNCRRCPGAYRALRGLRSFMSANTFGNAGFSVLLPGARLEGRCGPTNARVRCHLGEYSLSTNHPYFLLHHLFSAIGSFCTVVPIMTLFSESSLARPPEFCFHANYPVFHTDSHSPTTLPSFNLKESSLNCKWSLLLVLNRKYSENQL